MSEALNYFKNVSLFVFILIMYLIYGLWVLHFRHNFEFSKNECISNLYFYQLKHTFELTFDLTSNLNCSMWTHSINILLIYTSLSQKSHQFDLNWTKKKTICIFFKSHIKRFHIFLIFGEVHLCPNSITHNMFIA